LWFYYGVALRTIGNYDIPLGAIPLLDAYEASKDPFLLRMGYSGTLAVWNCVDPSGVGYHTRDTRFNPPPEGSESYSTYLNGHFSGELGVGLYGNLHALKSYLVRNGDFGLVGYGCEVKETEEWYILEPRDGLGVRTFFEPVDVHVEAVRTRMESIRVRKDKSRVAIKCRRPYPHADSGWVRLRGMPAGKYAVRAGDVEQVVNTDGGTLECSVSLGRGATEVQVWWT